MMLAQIATWRHCLLTGLCKGHAPHVGPELCIPIMSTKHMCSDECGIGHSIHAVVARPLSFNVSD